jgi:integrase
MKTRKPKLGSIYLRGRLWWVKYHRHGQVFRESSGSEEYSDAERFLKRRLGELATGRFAGLGPERTRMDELFDDLLEDYRLNGRKSLVQTESRIRVHLRPAFGALRVADLSTHAIKRYIAGRLHDGAAHATVNRELEHIEHALTLGARCEPPKVLRPIHIPMLDERNVRTGFLDDAGYLRLRQELPEHLRPIFVVAYHVGNRLGELRGLRWDQVDFAHNQILLNPGETKNERGRALPIYGEMRPVLVMEKAIRDANFPACAYVFQNEGRPLGEFRKAWASACERAGVPGLLFHDLRRSAIRNMRLAGVPENVAMEISGHRTRAVFDRYSIVGARDLQDAALKMEQRFQTSLGTILGTMGTEEGKPRVAKAVN